MLKDPYNITFYADNIDPRIPEMQRKAFEALGFTIHQVKPHKWEGHGGTIDGWLRGNLDTLDEDRPIILWDIDCIPLSRGVVVALGFNAEILGVLCGVIQRASHIPDSIDYVGPACMAFTPRMYKNFGSPTFGCTDRSDCGGEMTHKAMELGFPFHFLRPYHVEHPEWELTDGSKFGKGTTFGGSSGVYHAFLSRKGNVEPFLRKCEEVIKSHERISKV